MNQAEMWLSAGTLFIETGMWYLALKSLKRTEESIRDTNNQNAVTNQRDQWKVALVAYRKLITTTSYYSTQITKENRDSHKRLILEIQFFLFISTWSKEYLLYTHLADNKLIKECAGEQLKVIYVTYSNLLGGIPGYLNDIYMLKEALVRCDILKSR